MSTPIILYDFNGVPLHTEEYTIYGNDRVLAVTPPERGHSVYVTGTWTGVVTNTLIATPTINSTLEILDIVVSASKKTGGTITVRFNDGDTTDVLFYGSVDDAALNLSTSPRGKIEGWGNAYLEYSTAGATFGGSILITYVKKTKPGPTYAEWNARR